MKRTIQFCILLTACLMASLASHAQLKINGKPVVYDKMSNTYMVSIPEKSFGKDYEAVITLDADSAWSHLKIENTNIESNYVFQKVEGNKEYTLQAERNQQAIKAKITFTFLPILDLKGNFGYEYANGSLSLMSPDDIEPVTTLLKAKWRGGSTNKADKHKRNYKIKTLNEKGQSKDISFLGMREDNNWIMDAGQIDRFRLRNRIATELWNDFATKPYYFDKEPKAKSGVTGKVVEVVLNNEYRGIYSLTEAMDRKEMKLKKYDEKTGEIHGQLWKASTWDKTQFWGIEKDYDDTQETWHGFETKYPDIEDVNPTDYSTLYNAIDFVANSDDETFKKEASNYFDLPVLIDYHIFMEVIKPVDNRGKNIYWAVYDKTKSPKLTLAVWDLDATVGQDWHCSDPLHPDYVWPNTSMGIKEVFYLYKRLCSLDADHYNEKLEARFKELEKTYLSKEQLHERYQRYYDTLKNSGAAQREERKWSRDSDIGNYELNFDEEINYIANWLQERFTYLHSSDSPIFTAIKNISQEKQEQASSIYNILGQKVSNSYRGIKIRNGKKFVHIQQ